MELTLSVDRALERSTGSLRFEPTLERRYQADSAPARRSHLRIALLVAIFIYGCFSAWDWMLLESNFWYISALSALVALSGMAALFGLHHLPPEHQAREWLGIVPSMLAYLPPILTVDSSDAGNRALWMMVLPLMIIYTNGCIAPPFRQALVHSGVALIGIALAAAVNGLPFTEGILVMAVSLATALFTLLSCYWMEGAHRRAYLLALRERLRNDALALSNLQLEHQSSTDSLTGVANRRALMRYLELLQHQARQQGRPLGLLMIDVDHFKAYNDTYGHPAGDRCLQQVAAALKAPLQSRDCLARYGGEEFAVLLVDRSEAQTRLVAQQLLETIRALAIDHYGASGPVRRLSISIGGVHDGAWLSAEQLLEAADRQLYAAKQAGRDRLCLAESLPLVFAPEQTDHSPR